MQEKNLAGIFYCPKTFPTICEGKVGMIFFPNNSYTSQSLENEKANFPRLKIQQSE